MNCLIRRYYRGPVDTLAIADEAVRGHKESLQHQAPAERETSPLVLKELHDLSPQAKQEIAHRLNNQLQVIVGTAEMIADDARGFTIELAASRMRNDLRELFGI